MRSQSGAMTLRAECVVDGLCLPHPNKHAYLLWTPPHTGTQGLHTRQQQLILLTLIGIWAGLIHVRNGLLGIHIHRKYHPSKKNLSNKGGRSILQQSLHKIRLQPEK